MVQFHPIHPGFSPSLFIFRLDNDSHFTWFRWMASMVRPTNNDEADNWYIVENRKQRKRIQDRLAQRARRMSSPLALLQHP